MNSLIDKLRKNTTIEDSSVLSKSKFFLEKDMIRTSVPMVNVALSGRLDGGLTPGLTMFAGQSKMFKTGFTLLLMKAYMDMYPEAGVLFYDSEFGTATGSYFQAFGIDESKILHTPLTDIEQLKSDIMNQLKNVDRGDKLFIGIDSIGNLASRKEVEDALSEKHVADMTRAKQLKSLFRMVTPHLNIKDIPMVVVNHTYKEIGMFPKDIVGGGQGSYLSGDNIYIISRKQESETDKDTKYKKVTGYDFILTVEKSRYVKEKARIPVTISYEEGISKWSGLMDNAVEAGLVKRDRGDVYNGIPFEETNTKEFWEPILRNGKFQEFISSKYLISSGNIIREPEVDIYSDEVKKTFK